MASLTIPPRKPTQATDTDFSKLTTANRSKPENKRNIVNETDALVEMQNIVLQRKAMAQESGTKFDDELQKAYTRRYNAQYDQFVAKYGIDPQITEETTDQDVVLDDPKAPILPPGMTQLDYARKLYMLDTGGSATVPPSETPVVNPDGSYTPRDETSGGLILHSGDQGVPDLPGGGRDENSPLNLQPPLKGNQTLDDMFKERFDGSQGEDLLGGGDAEDQIKTDTATTQNIQLMREASDLFSSPPDDPKKVDPADPIGIRILNGAKATAADIGGGVKEAISGQVLGGILDAGTNALNAADDLAYWLNENVYNFDDLATSVNNKLGVEVFATAAKAKAAGGFPDLPKLDAPTTVTGSLVRGASQFLAGFIPIFKGIKVLSGGAALGGAAVNVARGILASGAAQSLVFDPMEGRVSDLLKELDATPDVLLPVLDYLATSPDDTKATGRQKNFLEGMLLGAVGEGLVKGVVKGLDAVRYLRNARDPVAGLPDVDIGSDFSPGVRLTRERTVVPQGVQPGSREALEDELARVTKIIDNFDSKIEQGHAQAKTFRRFDPAEIGIEQTKLHSVDAPQLRVAFRDADGTVIQGKPGEVHADVATRLNIEGVAQEANKARFKINETSPKQWEAGFVDDNGKFLDRTEAKKLVDKHRLSVLTPADRTNLKKAQVRAEELKQKLAGAKSSDEIAAANTKQETFNTDYAANENAKTHEDLVKTIPPEDAVNGKLTKGYVKDGQFHTPEEARQVTLKAILAGPGKKLRFSGKPGTAFGDAAAEAKFIEGKSGLGPVVDSLDTGVIGSGKNILEAVERLKSMVKLEKNVPTKVSVKDVEKLAKRLGVKSSNLLEKQPDLGTDPIKVRAYTLLMDASENNIKKLAQGIIEGGDEVAGSEAALAAFVRRLNVHKTLQYQLAKGGIPGKEVDGMFARFGDGTPARSVAEELHNNLQALRDYGGAGRVRRFAAAIYENPNSEALNKALKSGNGTIIGDALTQYWYWSLLSGPVTHVVNVTSTLTNMLWQVSARNLAGTINEAILRNPYGVRAGEGREMMRAFYDSLGDAWRLGSKAYKTGKPSSSKFEYYIPQDAWSATNFGAEGTAVGSLFDFMGKMFKYTSTNALMAEDEFFRVISTNMEMRAIASRVASQKGFKYGSAEHTLEMQKTLRDPDALLLKKSHEFADLVTFQTELGNIGRSVQSTLAKGGIWAKLIVPFQRTPTNVMKQAIKDSPVGFISSSVRADLKAGGAAGQVAAAKMLLSTATAGLITQFVASDLITGIGPTDPALRATWSETHKPNSIWLGEDLGWVSYNRIDPAAIVFGTVASFAEGYYHWRPDEFAEGMVLIGTALSKSLFQKTWATSLAGAIDTAYDPGGPGAVKWLKKQAGSLAVPTGFAHLARFMDPVWRETRTTVDAMRARVPGLSQYLPPRRNVFGDKIWATALGPDLLSPFYEFVPPDKKTNPFWDWAWQNRLQTGMPSQIQRGVELDPWQMDAFLQLSGNALKDPATGLGMKDTLNGLLLGTHPQSAEFMKATDGPDGGKAYMVHQIMRKYREAALAYMYAKDETFRKQVDKAQQQKAYNLLVGPGELPGGQ